ncbi:MAG: hypothetical protein D3925_08915, partial [Candidatus Electrothrix sp. AR5]|nr:hypothetical protein [Candidatus Electrothrix sp. AR5]
MDIPSFGKIADFLIKENPVVFYIIIVLILIKWLFSFFKELVELNQFFAKSRFKKIKEAKQELQEFPEETHFYDETLRQELFYSLTGITCCKRDREFYQQLVKNGIATTEAIRQAWIFIKNDREKLKIKFNGVEKFSEWCSKAFILFGILIAPICLIDLLYNFNLSKFPNSLLVLSMAVLIISLSLKELLPILYAKGIKKRLEEKRESYSKGNTSSP